MFCHLGLNCVETPVRATAFLQSMETGRDMATFMQQHCDVANLNKFSFVPEGNLHLQSPPEYFDCFDVRTLSTFPDEFL